MQRFAQAHAFPFPYLHDEDQSVAQAYGAAAWRGAGNAEASYGRAATILKERGIRTPRGGQWTRAAVRSLIQRHQAQLAAREPLPSPVVIHSPQQQASV